MLKLHNSLTNQVQQFNPIKRGSVGFYSCGPTVYDQAHIGNLRTYIFEDTLRRVLKLNGYKVKHIMNLTDIDDKTIARSRQQYPKDEPKIALKKLTIEYEKQFYDNAAEVGIDFSDTKFARATEHITDMQAMISSIPNRYLAEDGIYFDLSKYSGYGVLIKLDHSHAHHRIRNDEYDKEHVADFALWKAAKPGEPAWDFKVDGKNIPGHPGWHIECSAMSVKYLGQPFDIHSGGVDLKFPHHENEIAQAKAVNGKNFAKYFVHAEHLLVENKKMAKRSHNFYTLADIVKKGFSPLAFRLLLLQAHYRSQLNFSWASLAASQAFLTRLYAMADRQFQPNTTKTAIDLDQWFSKTDENLLSVLNNDLDTPKALSWVAQVSDMIEANPIDKANQPKLKVFLGKLDNVFALGLAKRQDVTAAQKQLIETREAARLKKDYKTSDEIRKRLFKAGIGLNDNYYGVSWYRTS